MCGFDGNVEACLVPRKRSTGDFDVGRRWRAERIKVFANA